MKNKIEDLRNHLFMALEGLADEKNPMPLDRAEAISKVAQVLVNTANVEVDFLKVTGGLKSTGFMPIEDEFKPRKPEAIVRN